MVFRFGLTIAVLLALATKGHSELQCYVCDNCAKIDKNTPLEVCGAQVTTSAPETTETSSSSSSMSTTSGTSTTEETTSTTPASTTTGLPTPATVGPVSSTTGIPTPPSVVPVVVETITLPSVNHTSNSTSTTTPVIFVTPTVVTSGDITTTEEPIIVLPTTNVSVPSTFLVRQRRNIPVNGMTYHCYKVQKKYDGAYGIQRGCMGVMTQQSVCQELKMANNNQTHRCQPCSTNKCNGSSTIGVSIATVLVALVAVFYKV